MFVRPTICLDGAGYCLVGYLQTLQRLPDEHLGNVPGRNRVQRGHGFRSRQEMKMLHVSGCENRAAAKNPAADGGCHLKQN